MLRLSNPLIIFASKPITETNFAVKVYTCGDEEIVLYLEGGEPQEPEISE